jgi:L,D-peptidoglycan transpeptidase YkuD (ErfK/YbiS/YcfS/YnhG family)
MTSSFHVLLLFVGATAGAVSAPARPCPSYLDGAQRLVLVTTATMATSTATLRLMMREGPSKPWHRVGPAEPAMVGAAGLGWGVGFRKLARDSEPLKTEGDNRTPAGIYRLGQPFGFAASTRPGYLTIKAGTVCVDDPKSPAYNTITSRAVVGAKVHGEDMRKVSLYRRGIAVAYPADAAGRGGSCIFIHIWRGIGRATSGCVALPAKRVTALQAFAAGGAVIAVLPQQALKRFAQCLPMISQASPGRSGAASARQR